MNHTPDYRKATNAAYRLLAKRESLTLTTDVMSIAKELLENCIVITYSQACCLYGYTVELLSRVSEFGFSIVHEERRIILYNESASLGCIRFTVAHEIGHAVLGHCNEHDSGAEREANCFARNLLCPLPIICGLNLNDPQEFVHVFNVTEKMALVSLNWIKSDEYYIEEALWDRIFDMYMEFVENYIIATQRELEVAS